MPELSYDPAFPTSEDILDYMESAGLSDYFRSFSTGNDTEIDTFFETLNSSEFNVSLNLSEFPLPALPPRRTTFEFVTVGLLLTLISIFGLMGNIVAIVVLSRPVMKGSFSSLLIGEY